METPVEDLPIHFQDAAIAYLLSVTSATLAFSLPRFVLDISNIFSGTGFESATGLDTLTKLKHLSSMSLILFGVGWILIFVAAVIPFSIAITVTRKFTWLYSILGGVLTALVLEPLFISIPNLGINVQEPEPLFWQQYLTALPHFLFSGTMAGLACHLYFRRKLPRGVKFVTGTSV